MIGTGQMISRKNFDSINLDVRSFYDYCKEAGMSEEEVDSISLPLIIAVRKALIRRRYLRIGVVVSMMVLVVLIAALCHLNQQYRWCTIAVTRFALVKFLPAWDWTPLYHKKCLIERAKPEVLDAGVPITHCIACEAIKNIPRVTDTSYTEVFHHHLLRGAPVIVEDAHFEWSPELNLTGLINDDARLSASVPCRQLTNIRTGRQAMDLEEIVSRITNTDIPSWFVHFQNCDLRAVKSFRVLAPRPYFLSPHIPPSHFSWLLLSKNYDTDKYKNLELDSGLIIMSQLKGTTFVKLRPRTPCEDDCYTLSFGVSEGETLVLGNHLWEFDYMPGKGENAAMITETDWNES